MLLSFKAHLCLLSPHWGLKLKTLLQHYILTICQGLRTAIMAPTWDPHPRTLPLDSGAISKLKLWALRPVSGPCCSGLLVVLAFLHGL